MADPDDAAAVKSALNQQILDALAQIKAMGGDVGEVAAGSLAQVVAQAAGLAMLNAVNAQQSAYIAANATVLATVTRILAGGRATAPASPP